jgi:hypothetical protein
MAIPYACFPNLRKDWPITVVAWSKTRTIFYHSSTGIMSSNPLVPWIYICALFLCYPLYFEALWWTDPPYKESYKVSVRVIISKANSELEQARRPNPWRKERRKKKKWFSLNIEWVCHWEMGRYLSPVYCI